MQGMPRQACMQQLHVEEPHLKKKPLNPLHMCVVHFVHSPAAASHPGMRAAAGGYCSDGSLLEVLPVRTPGGRACCSRRPAQASWRLPPRDRCAKGGRLQRTDAAPVTFHCSLAPQSLWLHVDMPQQLSHPSSSSQAAPCAMQDRGPDYLCADGCMHRHLLCCWAGSGGKQGPRPAGAGQASCRGGSMAGYRPAGAVACAVAAAAGLQGGVPGVLCYPTCWPPHGRPRILRHITAAWYNQSVPEPYCLPRQVAAGLCCMQLSCTTHSVLAGLGAAMC